MSAIPDSPPQLQLHISAPLLSAYTIPCISVDIVDSPSESRAFTGISFMSISEAIPTTPVLSSAAARTPAIAVP